MNSESFAYGVFITIGVFGIFILTYLLMKQLRRLEEKMVEPEPPKDQGKRQLSFARWWISALLVFFMIIWLTTLERLYNINLPPGGFAGIVVLVSMVPRVIGLCVISLGLSGWLLKRFFPKLASKCAGHILSREIRDNYRNFFRNIISPHIVKA